MATGDKTIIANKAYVDTVVSNIDLSTKQDVLVNGINIKTINGQSVLGNGNFELQAGATVVETVIAPNELKTVYTDNTVTVGGLNVSIMEEDVSTEETVGVFEPIYGNVDGIDSKNYALTDTLTFSATTAVLSTSTWDVNSVNKTIYEKGGRGIASIISINGSTATIKIITPFSKNVLNSGDWFMYSFLLNTNGDITLSKGNTEESAGEVKYIDMFQPSATTYKNGLMTQTDDLGTTHICFVGSVDGNSSLCYGRLINGVYHEEVNILNSNGNNLSMSSELYMLVDSNRTVHIATTCIKSGETDRKLVYGYKTENGYWIEVPEINQLSLVTTSFPIINETTAGNIDIVTKENDVLQFYRKVAGVWYKSAISQWNKEIIGNGRNYLQVLNLPNGAFEIYASNRAICCGYDGISLFYTGGITFATNQNVRGIMTIVEQDGNYRNVICCLLVGGAYSGDKKDTKVVTFNSRDVGDFTKTIITVPTITAPTIVPIDLIPGDVENDFYLTQSYYKDKITNDVYILFNNPRNSNNILIKKVDNVWYTYSNGKYVFLTATTFANNKHLKYINGYGLCIIPNSMNSSNPLFNSVMYDLDKLKPPYYTFIKRSNSIYTNHAIETLFIRIDNEGYVHCIFEQGTTNYTNNKIPCYLTNRTETGEFIIDYNFSNQLVTASTQRVSGLTVDANGVPYVLFASWKSNFVWKKVNGVWDGNYSTGVDITVPNYTFRKDEGRLFRVEHINEVEYIYINGYVYDATPKKYYPCEYKIVNRLMTTKRLDDKFTNGLPSFNPYTALWYTNKNNVTVVLPMSSLSQGKMNLVDGVYIHKGGVVTSHILPNNDNNYSYSEQAQEPSFIAEDGDGNIIILFMPSYKVTTTPQRLYIQLYLLIIDPNGNIIVQKPVSNWMCDTSRQPSYSYSTEEKRVYVYGLFTTDNNIYGHETALVFIDVAEILADTSASIYTKPTSYVRRRTKNIYTASCIAYNNIKKGMEGFLTDLTAPNELNHITSKKSSDAYINNEYVHVHLPAIYTKYWYEISAKSMFYITNGQFIDMSFSYNGNTYNVFKTGQIGNRKIVSNEGSITGFTDGVWCYNSSTDYTLETWVEAADKNKAFTLAKNIETNRMFNSDLVYGEISINDLLYFSVSLFSNNPAYSPRLKNLKLFYLSLAKWVNKTQNYEVYAQGIDSVFVKSLNNETKHIKVVHNG